ncbi:MAG: HAD family hydrolase [Chloroflexi bacterium]|nr:HAD family hydrolase [Chloroflexota bacterium]
MTDLVVLLDVDNTLLDNDLVRTGLEQELSGVLGRGQASRFWEIYEQVRAETDLVNFPETMERFGQECPDTGCLSRVSATLYAFPFDRYVFPESLSAIRHVASFATPVILSDGDQLFQRYKIRAAGLEEAVGGNVLVYVHKEQSTGDICKRFPATHYAIVDDKTWIHAAMKAAMGEQITTVMVCQGQYAHDPAHHSFPEADLTIEGIGGLLALGPEWLNASRA